MARGTKRSRVAAPMAGQVTPMAGMPIAGQPGPMMNGMMVPQMMPQMMMPQPTMHAALQPGMQHMQVVPQQPLQNGQESESESENGGGDAAAVAGPVMVADAAQPAQPAQAAQAAQVAPVAQPAQRGPGGGQPGPGAPRVYAPFQFEDAAMITRSASMVKSLSRQRLSEAVEFLEPRLDAAYTSELSVIGLLALIYAYCRIKPSARICDLRALFALECGFCDLLID